MEPLNHMDLLAPTDTRGDRLGASNLGALATLLFSGLVHHVAILQALRQILNHILHWLLTGLLEVLQLKLGKCFVFFT